MLSEGRYTGSTTLELNKIPDQVAVGQSLRAPEIAGRHHDGLGQTPMCKHRETGAEEMIRLSICSAGARIVQSTLRIRSRARSIIEPAMDAGLTARHARLPY